MNKTPTILRHVLLAAAALLLAACSFTRLAYNNVAMLYANATPMLAWIVDDYVDVNGAQKHWVNERLQRAMAWHRANELPEYVRLLDTIARRFEGDLTVDEVRASYGEIRDHYHRAIAHLFPDVADFLLQLEGEQVAQMEKKFAQDNRKTVKESTRGTPEERHRDRAQRVVMHVEEWVGRLDERQLALVDAALRELPELTTERLGDRRFRQNELLMLIRARPDHDTMVAGLQRLFVDTESWRRPEYLKRSREREERMFRMIAELSATLSPAQRKHFLERIRGYKRDFTQLSASAG